MARFQFLFFCTGIHSTLKVLAAIIRMFTMRCLDPSVLSITSNNLVSSKLCDLVLGRGGLTKMSIKKHGWLNAHFLGRFSMDAPMRLDCEHTQVGCSSLTTLFHIEDD